MKNQINLNKNTHIDRVKLLQSRMVILANSGGGKSYAIRKFAEDAMEDTQTILIDPEGEFSSLREKFDFILAGKNADVPVELRSAALLATKLLELGKSAIIDLYELRPQDRQRYVKLFFDAMINAPKELYHDVFIILDEAHEYAPEGKPSEATNAVEAMASRGRKRGFCLIPASQRISKLSKNISAECNNKLIGRASQDIDMKRAGDELGFSKEHMVQLRQLQPGEFFAFGPAISDEVIKVKIGEVKTVHAKVGYKNNNKVPPPSHVIKKVLGELADLPQEAEQEAKTVAELKKENAELKRLAKTLATGQKILKDNPPIDEKRVGTMIDYAVKKSEDKMWNMWDKYTSGVWMTCYNNLTSALRSLEAVKKDYPIKMVATEQIFRGMPVIIDKSKKEGEWEIKNIGIIPIDKKYSHLKNLKEPIDREREARINGNFDLIIELSKGEMTILKAIAQYPEEGATTEHIAVLTGYKATSRHEYLRKLFGKMYIRKANDIFFVTDLGMEALGDNHEPLPKGDELREHLLRTLPEGEKKVLTVILEAYPNEVSYEDIEQATGYKSTSRHEYLRKLKARKLVEVNRNMVKASDKLYE